MIINIAINGVNKLSKFFIYEIQKRSNMRIVAINDDYLTFQQIYNFIIADNDDINNKLLNLELINDYLLCNGELIKLFNKNNWLYYNTTLNIDFILDIYGNLNLCNKGYIKNNNMKIIKPFNPPKTKLFYVMGLNQTQYQNEIIIFTGNPVSNIIAMIINIINTYINLKYTITTITRIVTKNDNHNNSNLIKHKNKILNYSSPNIIVKSLNILFPQLTNKLLYITYTSYTYNKFLSLIYFTLLLNNDNKFLLQNINLFFYKAVNYDFNNIFQYYTYDNKYNNNILINPKLIIKNKLLKLNFLVNEFNYYVNNILNLIVFLKKLL